MNCIVAAESWNFVTRSLPPIAVPEIPTADPRFAGDELRACLGRAGCRQFGFAMSGGTTTNGFQAWPRGSASWARMGRAKPSGMTSG